MHFLYTVYSSAASLLFASFGYAIPTSSTAMTASSLSDPCATKAPIPGMTCYDFTRPNGEVVPIFVRTESTNTTNGTSIKNPFNYTPDTPQNQCGQSDFIKAKDDDPPSIDDCKAIAEWTSINDGGWVITHAQLQASKWYILYQVNDCAFAAGQQNSAYQPYYGTLVGNMDVTDLINDAAGRLGADNKLSATGNMPCISLVYDKPYPLNWIIGTPGAGWQDSGSG